jgi:hypothetical protein
MPLADYTRPKKPLHTTVSGYSAGGSVQYVAHLLLQDGRSLALGGAAEGTSGSTKKDHPDQVFWNDRKTLSLSQALEKLGAEKRHVDRVEIDCTLLPCEGTGGCTTTVPALMKDAGYDGLKVRVFSHRSEVSRKDVLPARYFDFTVGQRNTDLEAARVNEGGWKWAT